MTVQCTQNQPTYEAVQWDGTNQMQIADVLRVYHYTGNAPTWTVDQAGTLTIAFEYIGNFTLPADGWLVSAPSWTGEFTGPFETVTDVVFAARFTTV